MGSDLLSKPENFSAGKPAQKSIIPLKSNEDRNPCLLKGRGEVENINASRFRKPISVWV